MLDLLSEASPHLDLLIKDNGVERHFRVKPHKALPYADHTSKRYTRCANPSMQTQPCWGIRFFPTRSCRSR